MDDSELRQRLKAIEDALALLRFPLPPPLLSTVQAAKTLGVGEASVRRWVISGELPAVRLDLRSRTVYRVAQSDLEQFIAARKVGAPAQNKAAQSGGFIEIPDMGL